LARNGGAEAQPETARFHERADWAFSISVAHGFSNIDNPFPHSETKWGDDRRLLNDRVDRNGKDRLTLRASPVSRKLQYAKVCPQRRHQVRQAPPRHCPCRKKMRIAGRRNEFVRRTFTVMIIYKKDRCRATTAFD